MHKALLILACMLSCTVRGRRILPTSESLPAHGNAAGQLNQAEMLAALLDSSETAAAFNPSGLASNPHLPRVRLPVGNSAFTGTHQVGRHDVRVVAPRMSGKFTPIENPKLDAYLEEYGITPPAGLSSLVGLLVGRGETALEPGTDKSIFPLLVPLTRNETSGEVTGLLRFLDPNKEDKLPVVQTKGKQMMMLADCAAHFVANAAAIADSEGAEDAADLIALSEAADISYVPGSAASAQAGAEGYIIFKIGPNMQIYRDLASRHSDNGDELRALVTCDRIEKVYPEWGASYAFHGRILNNSEGDRRHLEAMGKSREAFLCPLWTLMDDVEEVASWYNKNRTFCRQERQIKLDGKLTPEELVMAGGADTRTIAERSRDRAVALLDLIVLSPFEESWESVREELAKFLEKGEMYKLAKMVAME